MACTLRFVGRDSEGVKNLLYITDTTSTGMVGYIITLNGNTIYSDGITAPHAAGSTISLSAPNTDGVITNGTYHVYQRIIGESAYENDFVLNYTIPANTLSLTIDGYSSTVVCRDSTLYTGLTVSNYLLTHSQPTVGDTTSLTTPFTIPSTIYAGTHTLSLVADILWTGTLVTLEDRLEYSTTDTAYLLDENTIMDAVDAYKASYRLNLVNNKSEARNQRAVIAEIDLYEDDYWVAIRRYDKLTAYLSLLQIYDLLNETLVAEGEIPVYESLPEAIERIDTELIRLGYGMTEGTTTHDYIDFNTSYNNGDVEGRMHWSADDGTLEVCLEGGNVHLQVGQETVIRCKNATGSPIPNGAVVYINGASGQRPTIALADADSYTTSFVLGVATELIGNGQNGYITITGLVRELNTNGLTEGAPIWLSQTAGQFTTTRPTAPALSVFLGYIVYEHSSQGMIAVRPSFVPRLIGLSDVYGNPSDGNIPTYVGANSRFEFNKNINDYKTYSGFENRTDSSISIDSNGVFTIIPTGSSYNVYTNGSGKHEISTSKTVTVTADQTITYIYFDSNGDIQSSTTPWSLSSGVVAPVSIVFKDGSTYAITDERHGYERNKAWHNWAHFNIGTMYRSGLTGIFTDTTLSVAQGVISDEDINFDTTNTKTTCSLWYRNGLSGMRLIRNSSTPYRAVAGVLQYDDGSGTLQPVTNNRYSTQWVYCSNDAAEPIYVVVGQNNDINVTNARNATRPIINLSTAEWKLIYRIIYRNVGGVATFIEAADFRTVQTGVSTSSTTTDHSAQINRDATNSHPKEAITGLTLADSPEFADTQITNLNSDAVAGGVIPAAKFTWLGATAKSVLSFISKLVDKTYDLATRVGLLEDKYILKYVVPVNTTLIELTTDKYGNAFNFVEGDTLQITFNIAAWTVITSNLARINMRINNISSSIYNVQNVVTLTEAITAGTNYKSQRTTITITLINNEVVGVISNQSINLTDVKVTEFYPFYTTGLNSSTISSLKLLLSNSNAMIPAGTVFLIKKI